MSSIEKDSNIYWPSFSAICLFVLVSVFAIGIFDREVLASLIETGGLIESLPFGLLVLAGLTSFAVAIRTKRSIRWLCFGAFCLFLAGEEAAWGSESIFGWKPMPERVPLGSPDLHNAISSDLKEQLFGDSYPGLPDSVRYVVYAAIILVAGGFLILSLLLGTLGRDRFINSNRLKRLRIPDTPMQFFITGFGLMAFANVDFFQAAGIEYMPGVWPLEESYELLGSVAFLYVPLVKFLDTCRLQA